MPVLGSALEQVKRGSGEIALATVTAMSWTYGRRKAAKYLHNEDLGDMFENMPTTAIITTETFITRQRQNPGFPVYSHGRRRVWIISSLAQHELGY